MSRISPLYPRGPFNFHGRVHALPPNGSIPLLSDWRAIRTPGHSPGHISLFRDTDRVLVAGDAFVTTKQESGVGALLKPREVHGPPAYFTHDWDAAAHSVEVLAALEPSAAGAGHGRLLGGEPLREGLNRLAREFDTIAVPQHGRYVAQPAVFDANGVVSVPPAGGRGRPGARMGVCLAGAAGLLVWACSGKWKATRARNRGPRTAIDQPAIQR